MRRIVFLLALLAGTCAMANEKPINDKIVLMNLDRAFEQAAASLGLATVIYDGQCDDKSPVTCSFKGAGQIEIHALGASADAPPTNISLFYVPGGDPNPFLMNVGILVAVSEPQMPQDERAAIITSIIQNVAGQRTDNVINGSNAQFTATNVGGLVIVVAEKAQ